MVTPRRANARIDASIRQEIRESPESLKVLGQRYGINPKTVAKWKARESCEDLRSGPKPGGYRTLSAEDEQIIVTFRERTQLPLDDCLYALQAPIPQLTRSTLHRCLRRHGISRQADEAIASDGAADVAIGSLYVDKTEITSTDGAHHLFSAVDEPSKFAFVWLPGFGERAETSTFLDLLAERLPFRIHTILTLRSGPFASLEDGAEFSLLCQERGIVHRCATSQHPWARYRLARMGRMIEESITFASGADLASVLGNFVRAYNYRRRLKTLRGRTPHQAICQAWIEAPHRFRSDPHHEIVGLETTFDRSRDQL